MSDKDEIVRALGELDEAMAEKIAERLKAGFIEEASKAELDKVSGPTGAYAPPRAWGSSGASSAPVGYTATGPGPGATGMWVQNPWPPPWSTRDSIVEAAHGLGIGPVEIMDSTDGMATVRVRGEVRRSVAREFERQVKERLAVTASVTFHYDRLVRDRTTDELAQEFEDAIAGVLSAK